ncbi:hypothetical protein CKO51_27345 [Rhodopirellula sp. SM50]|nr:hypothetical protein CKO51_27345 [Rhodopirellula sp. SM50]
MPSADSNLDNEAAPKTVPVDFDGVAGGGDAAATVSDIEISLNNSASNGEPAPADGVCDIASAITIAAIAVDSFGNPTGVRAAGFRCKWIMDQSLGATGSVEVCVTKRNASRNVNEKLSCIAKVVGIGTTTRKKQKWVWGCWQNISVRKNRGQRCKMGSRHRLQHADHFPVGLFLSLLSGTSGLHLRGDV